MSKDCRSTLKAHLYGKGNASPGTERVVPSLSHMQAAQPNLQRALRAPTSDPSSLAHGQAQTEHSNATPGSKDVEHLP